MRQHCSCCCSSRCVGLPIVRYCRWQTTKIPTNSGRDSSWIPSCCRWLSVRSSTITTSVSHCRFPIKHPSSMINFHPLFWSYLVLDNDSINNQERRVSFSRTSRNALPKQSQASGRVYNWTWSGCNNVWRRSEQVYSL